MTCSKAQSMITQFINNKLSLQETDEFINHVSSCAECKEELEVYYALLTAMKQLDEDKTLTSDFHQELNDKLEQAKERIVHARFTYYRKKIILILTILLLALFISMRYAVMSVEEHNVAQSEFRLRTSFNNRRPKEYERLLQEYYRRQNAGSAAPTLFP